MTFTSEERNTIATELRENEFFLYYYERDSENFDVFSLSAWKNYTPLGGDEYMYVEIAVDSDQPYCISYNGDTHNRTVPVKSFSTLEECITYYNLMI